MRSKRIYLAAVCHKIGVNGVGPHKHNDWLSFELCVDGQPVIIDPGTYCYTGNMEMRRLFRSTAYHNTVVVDGKEQLKIDKSIFGLMNPHGDIRLLRWESGDTQDLLEAEHTGYTRLAEPLIHRRRFLLNKRRNEVEITDTFIGHGEHLFTWYLHLNEGLHSKEGDRKLAILKGRQIVMRIALPDFKNRPLEKQAWLSKAYNRLKNTKSVCFKEITNASSNPFFTQRIFINEDFLEDEKE